MVDLEWKSKMVSSNMSPKSPKLSLPQKPMPNAPLPLTQNDISAASSPVCAAYDNYLNLPQFRKLWANNDFPDWANEPVIKPTLHALEITFRFISTIFSDPRPYANRREWTRRVESLAKTQIQIIAMLCEDEEQNPETRGTAPVSDVSFITQSRSYSEASLLPKLATWKNTKDVAQRILASVESEMSRCSYTIGLGEPNIAGKPILQYDAVCRPNDIPSKSMKTTPYDHIENYENRTLHATHQLVELWSRVARVLLDRVAVSVERRSFEKAASDCYAVEWIWKLLAEIEDLHLMMDPNDFLRLKKQLAIRSSGETVPFCFRSKELVEITKVCRDLKQKVPDILDVKVDPKGGPNVVEAAMRVYTEKSSGFEKVLLLQAMQAIESAMKRFFYAYKQVVAMVMGSTEASGNRFDSGDSLSQIFLEPALFPSLDAAKIFLGYYWDNNENVVAW